LDPVTRSHLIDMNIQEPKENPGLTEIPAEPEKPGKIIRLAQKKHKENFDKCFEQYFSVE
jgi:hypothetical protein